MTAVTLSKTVVRPVAEYGLQFTKTSLKLLRAYEALEYRIITVPEIYISQNIKWPVLLLVFGLG